MAYNSSIPTLRVPCNSSIPTQFIAFPLRYSPLSPSVVPPTPSFSTVCIVCNSSMPHSPYYLQVFQQKNQIHRTLLFACHSSIPHSPISCNSNTSHYILLLSTVQNCTLLLSASLLHRMLCIAFPSSIPYSLLGSSVHAYFFLSLEYGEQGNDRVPVCLVCYIMPCNYCVVLPALQIRYRALYQRSP